MSTAHLVSPVTSLQDFCHFFDLPIRTIKFYVEGFRRGDSPFYTTVEIPKKGGGVRLLDIPSPDLLGIQKKIAAKLQSIYFLEAPSCAFGFVPKRSLIDNVRPHIGRDYILKIDLKDFFPSINGARIYNLFVKRYMFSDFCARTLVNLTIYKNRLPQGSPVSPVLSNMICKWMDRHLLKEARTRHIHFTRYADDMTFSCFAKDLTSMFNLESNAPADWIMKTIQKSYFQINERKTILRSQTQRQVVTGIVCNRKLNVRRSFVRKLRAALHRASIDEGFRAEARSMLAGRISFLRMVVLSNAERDQKDGLIVYAKYARRFNEIYGRSFSDADVVSDPAEYMASTTAQIVCGVPLGSGFFVRNFFISAKHVFEGVNMQKIGCLKLKVLPRNEFIFSKAKVIRVPYSDFKTCGDIIVFRLCVGRETSDRNARLAPYSATHYRLGASVRFAGFPDSIRDNSWDTINVSRAYITKWHQFLQERDGRIVIEGAVMYHGMSGGPVFNEHCEVIGVITNGRQERDDKSVEMLSMFAPFNKSIIDHLFWDSYKK